MEIAIKGLQQEFSELFDKVSVARFHLERYRKVEQELKKFDLNLQNLQKVNTIIENVNIIGSDPKCIIRELTEIKNCRQERRTAQNEKLVSENSKLSFENQTLRSELDLKSVNLRSLNERHKAIEQEFDRRSFQKVLEYENKIKEERKAYLAAEARNIQNINTLKAKEKQQMSILNKINVPFELSPIIDAARGWQVDGESLKRATIISIELLCSRLDDNHNWEAKSKMLQPLRSLKEEFIIF